MPFKLLNIKLLLLLIINVFIIKSYAQDPQFSQLYAISNYISPSFVGTKNGTRLSSIYRNQWFNLTNPYNTYAFSIDHFLREKKIGIGFLSLKDKSGQGALTTTTYEQIFSFHIKNPNNNSYLIPAISFSYNSRGLEFDELIFKDMILNNTTSSLYENPTQDIKYFNANSSLLYLSKSFWLGLTVNNLIRPNVSITNNESLLPMKYTFLGGFKTKQNRPKRSKENTHTIAYLYKHQNKFDQLDIGFYYNISDLTLGFWYRGIMFKRYESKYPNNDAIIILFGYKTNNIYFAYSHDITISGLFYPAIGTNEVSLGIEIPSKTRSKKTNPNKNYVCPTF